MIPEGLKLLQRADRSFQYTVEGLKKCCEKHKECLYKEECKKEFDHQVDTRKGYSWRLRKGAK